MGLQTDLWILLKSEPDGDVQVYSVFTDLAEAEEEMRWLRATGHRCYLRHSFVRTPWQKLRLKVRDTINRIAAKRYTRWIGGRRFKVARPEHQKWRKGFGKPSQRYWLNAPICRVLGHALDGSEWGTSGGGLYDAWCARCFHFYKELRWDQVPWLQAKHYSMMRQGALPPIKNDVPQA